MKSLNEFFIKTPFENVKANGVANFLNMGKNCVSATKDPAI